MDTTQAGLLSELQLGIRELFRIVIPGAYALGLLYLIAPQSEATALVSQGYLSISTYIFFIGLTGYALRINQKWWPFVGVFVRGIDRLDKAIRASAPATMENEEGESTDPYVHAYKYFLQTKAPEMRDRVHYFTSFYYMLTELSLFSFLGAVFLLFYHLRPGPQAGGSHLLSVAVCVCVFLAVSLQVGFVLGIIQPGNTGSSIYLWLPFFILGLAFVLLMIFHYLADTAGLLRSIFNYWSVILFFLFSAFQRLAASQWEQIIGEQEVLVQDKAQDIKTLIEKVTI